ncbi:MAG: hypothetical protein ABI579_05545 [Candidatus Sumerlaeota bacterium]
MQARMPIDNSEERGSFQLFGDDIMQMVLSMCPKRIVFILLICAAVAVSPSSGPTSFPDPISLPPPHKEFFHDIPDETKTSDIIIKGHLQDEEGRPVNGAKCLITTFKPKGDFGQERDEYRTLKSDFSLSFTGVMRVDLAFMAENFEILDAGFDVNDTDDDVSYRDKAEYYNRTFTLKKITKAPVLWKGEPSLSLTYEKIRMYRMDNFDKDPYSNPLTGHRHFDDTTVTLSLDYPFLYPKLSDAAGEEPVMVTNYDGSQYEAFPRDKTAALCLSGGDEGDGFLPYSMAPQDYKTHFFPVAMALAPSGPYISEMNISKELFVKTKQKPFPDTYFFFRLKGKYGKGRLSSFYDERKRELSLDVNIYLQPDGSSNVITRNE